MPFAALLLLQLWLPSLCLRACVSWTGWACMGVCFVLLLPGTPGLLTNVLQLPPGRERYELCLLKDSSGAKGGTEGGEGGGEEGSSGGAGGTGGSGNGTVVERFQFSRCRRLLPAASMRRLGVPLPPEEREVLHEGLGWEEIQVGKENILRKRRWARLECVFCC